MLVGACALGGATPTVCFQLYDLTPAQGTAYCAAIPGATWTPDALCPTSGQDRCCPANMVVTCYYQAGNC